MTSELRRQLKTLKSGDHACSISENAAAQQAIVAPFVMEGLRQGERCLYAAADSAMADLIQSLNANLVDVTCEQDRGTVLLFSERERFLRTGEFSPQRMLEFLSQEEAVSLKAGFSGIRLVVDMAWLLGVNASLALVLEYETQLNTVIENSRTTLLCQYDRSCFESELIQAVLRTHPITILGDLVCQNCFYEPPRIILSESQAAVRVDWKIAQIQRIRLANHRQQQESDLLRAVVEGVNDALFVKDRQGRYLLMNTTGAQILGKSIAEILGKYDADLFAPETAIDITDSDRRILDTEAFETCEQVATAAGITKTYWLTKGPYHDEFGNVAGIIGIARDITESKRHQAERDRLTERLRLQIERMPLAYILLDSNHRVVEWNPAAEMVFGYSKEEMLGQECVQRLCRLPHENQLQEILRRIESGDLRAHSVNQNRTKDDCTITCRWFNTPELDSEGRYQGLISLAQDITESQRVEQLLNRTRLRLEAMFHNALDCIVLFDDLLCFLDCNPAACAFFGYNREELLKMTAWSVTEIDTHGKIPDLFRQLVSAGNLSGDHIVVCKSGERKDVEYRAVANILPGIHNVFFRDITSRLRVEQALRENVERLQFLSRRVIEIQERERRHLSRELQEEIGQVLSAIGINLKAAQDVASAAVRTRLDDSIRIVEGAIQQVRVLSLDLRPSMLDDLGLISTLRWYADGQAKRAGFELKFLAEYFGDPLTPELSTTCYRVVQEALTNVVRHAHAKKVWLEVRGDHTKLELLIRDDGIGFDVATIRRLSKSGVYFGIMGMQERVQQFGGQVSIESEPNGGTVVIARFSFSSIHIRPT